MGDPRTDSDRQERWRSRLDRQAKRPRREPITLERIVDVSFAIMATEGYEALSMRRIAQELGTGPASLYAHVASKAELDSILIDVMASDFSLPAPDPERWKDQVAEVGQGMRRAMNEHPGIARAIMGMVPTSENALAAADNLLGMLLAGGLHPQVAAWACDLLPLYVTAITFEENIQSQGGDGRPHSEQEAEFIAELREYFGSLPADRFPNISAHVEEMTTGGGEERFAFGLRVLVEGLEQVSNQMKARC